MENMLAQLEPMIPALRRYARGLLRDVEAADDLVQDCLERVVSNWSGRKNEDPRTWVFTILHNLAINRFRQQTRRGHAVPLEDLPEQSFSVAASQEDTIFGKEVLTALDRLPPDHRGIILLISVEDLSYAEAAKVLGVPLGTVMSRLSRAREQLKAMLERSTIQPEADKPFLRRVK
ncbi:putative ECF sigma factor [Rhizobium freirei PRF 81]|uniref:Putative ECF sigma factor n=1 Tax=Rhizobium freirei PRF 81 TaxID=363754 RepID=N6V1E1_9HYPH|nr:RNA polymerase sigma factor [Rhizobium freirei]ENN86846.1 putative ECF sigma factor [Rhizobium freirei PRF 81]